ncbi:MAG TPA: carbohydrate ABC transporter permease [Anaerolineales bacterium]|jgi:multiple sugar transport system permease protein|nr:carbohydrate ABC transporter permease [Anaerolineales bacterium]
MTTSAVKASKTIFQDQAFFKRSYWSLGKVISLLLLIGVSILFVIPLLWMISTSLKEAQDLVGTRWIPTRFAWENYVDAFSFGMWPQWTLNTVIITVSSVIGQVFSSSLVAYAFSRLRWRGRDTLFSLVLATMMLPSVVTMIPQFVLFANLPAFGFMGSKVWTNTFLPLIVPAFTGSAFYIFLLRQFMRGIPQDLTDAARIDGAGELRIWWSIIMPMTKPALAVVAIFTFQGAWQDFMGPLLYLQSEKWYTLQLGLRQFEAAAGGSPAWHWLMAASLMVMLPVLIVFIAFQRYFIEGFNFSGLAGR